MSMFDNIIFDEFTLLEGEQAEAYKKRKGEEKDKDLEHSYNRAIRYNTAGMEQYKGDNRKAYKMLSLRLKLLNLLLKGINLIDSQSMMPKKPRRILTTIVILIRLRQV